MLVLSRRTNERIVIGDDVVVTVLRVNRGRVKIGVEAHRDVEIRRSEPSLSEAADEAAVAKVLAVAKLRDDDLEGMSREELIELIGMTCAPTDEQFDDKDHAELLRLASLVCWGCRVQLKHDPTLSRDTHIFKDTHLDS